MDTVKELLKQLINAPSTPEYGELETANILSHFFEQHGISAQIDVWQENRANVTATIKGDGTSDSLLFACHNRIKI